jgi:hypothetical protein
MVAWTDDELSRISTPDELQIAPVRHDGTLRSPRPIWAVRLGRSLMEAPSIRPPCQQERKRFETCRKLI